MIGNLFSMQNPVLPGGSLTTAAAPFNGLNVETEQTAVFSQLAAATHLVMPQPASVVLACRAVLFGAAPRNFIFHVTEKCPDDPSDRNKRQDRDDDVDGRGKGSRRGSNDWDSPGRSGGSEPDFGGGSRNEPI